MTGDDPFYDRYLAPLERRMLQTVQRVLRDREAARDALQDALVRIWERRGVVAEHPHPQALLLRICYHAAIDALRRRCRQRETTGLALDEWLAAPDRGPQTACDHEERRRAVLAGIAQLPQQQALAVLLRSLEERPYAEVARVMGCSPVTARIHAMRARSRLRRLLSHLAGGTATEGEPR